ncbi:MAG: hypothetical protein LBE79_07935 [Tannerella sp.]|jgi:hypothetical protein|nr:hypothetical protein [Tannerella sp.]
MKKNKPAQKQQLLSPENYIRQKSRNLPIDRCYINRDWKKAQICNIIVIRKHASGNVTSCNYLVDLACLGIKDSGYKFNRPADETDNMINAGKDDGLEFKEVPYELVHNIIHSALEYAEDYGFKPHKDFTSITSYFLEEDTDDIPLQHIACGGNDGNPLYVNTGFESPARVKQILAQLDQTAGNGNYHYILHLNDMDEDEDEDEFEESYAELDTDGKAFLEEINSLTIEEKKKQYFELVSKNNNPRYNSSETEVHRMLFIGRSIAYELADIADMKNHLKRFWRIFDFETADYEELPNSLFTDIHDSEVETATDLFFEAIDKIYSGKNPQKAIAELYKQTGDVPVVDFLGLYYWHKNDKKKFRRKFEESYRKFPDYLLFKIYELVSLHENGKPLDLEVIEHIILNEKKPITVFELEFLLINSLFILININTPDFARIIAFENMIMNMDEISEDIYLQLTSMIHSKLMSMIFTHFDDLGKSK